jgi:hypothetical protein
MNHQRKRERHTHLFSSAKFRSTLKLGILLMGASLFGVSALANSSPNQGTAAEKGTIYLPYNTGSPNNSRLLF